MEMKGEYRIAAPRDRVWEALNDPEVLKQCIPGCEDLEKVSPTEFTAKVTAAVGPVKARFGGNVTLSDLNPPESYTISGEGKGGAAGFAKGGAKVHLVEDGASATLLSYEVSATVGGKLAQLGGRLIDGTAKKMADQFFRCFSERVGVTAPAAEAPPVEPVPAAAAKPTAAEPVAGGPVVAEQGRPGVAVDRGAAFPPAQPSAHTAASAAVGGPGTGMKALSETPEAQPSETAAEHEAAAGSHADRPGPAEAGRAAAVTETPISRTGGDHARKPATKGLSPVTWIAGLVLVLLILILLIA